MASIFLKRRVFSHWTNFFLNKNYRLPDEFRKYRLKHVFFETVRKTLREKWNQERSFIIERSLQRKRREKLLKMVFLSFLENILIEKKRRIIESTVRDFKDHTLMGRGFRGLKRLWAKTSKENLLNKVAKDFYNKIMRRRQLRQRQYCESRGLSFTNEEAQMKQRVFTGWRMQTEHKLTKETVLLRFREFKKRLMLLRTFLGWRSVSRYEHSIVTNQLSTQKEPNCYSLPRSITSPMNHLNPVQDRGFD